MRIETRKVAKYFDSRTTQKLPSFLPLLAVCSLLIVLRCREVCCELLSRPLFIGVEPHLLSILNHHLQLLNSRFSPSSADSNLKSWISLFEFCEDNSDVNLLSQLGGKLQSRASRSYVLGFPLFRA